MPHDFPSWDAVYQQARRWLDAGVFEAITHGLRAIIRLVSNRGTELTAVILDGRTLQSTPVSGGRAGYDGHKKRKGSKVHAAVDTLGHLLAITVTPANEQERQRVAELTAGIQEVTHEQVTVAYVDQGYTGDQPRNDATENGIQLQVVKHTEAKKGFVLLPRRWVVERTFAWLGRSRRLTHDYERLAKVLAGWHWVAMMSLLIK